MTRTNLLGIWNEIEKRDDNYERDYSVARTCRKVIFARANVSRRKCEYVDANKTRIAF